MPQRTNPFQELVSLIRRAFARDGDSVEESAMVQVQGLETEREIDILHKTSDGMCTIKISVEAKDEARPIDLTTLEQLCAKYRGEGRVCVDKFIVVSRNGFTAGAIEKAKLLDVPLLTLDEAKEFDWAKLGPEYHRLPQMQTMHFQFPPHIDEILVEPPIPKDLLPQVIRHGRVLCPTCRDGRDHGTLVEFITRYTFGGHDPRMVAYLQQLDKMVAESPGGAAVTWNGEFKGHRVRFQGTDYPIDWLRVMVHAINSVVPVTCTPYEMASADGARTLVPHMSAYIGDLKLRWIMPQGLNSKRITLDMRRTPKERADARNKERRRRKKGQKGSPGEL